MRRLIFSCFHLLQWLILKWTKPLHTSLLLGTVMDLTRGEPELVAENALLRQQLIILRRQIKRPSYPRTDRLLLILRARAVRVWRQALVIVQPETLLRWHRQGFRLFWKQKSKPKSTQAKVTAETIALIKQMAKHNRRLRSRTDPGRIAQAGYSRLQTHDSEVHAACAHASIKRPELEDLPQQSCGEIWARDFLQVTDLFFRSLFAFFIIELRSRKVIHVGVTRAPTDAWTAQQLREATPYGHTPKYLIRDHDSKFGPGFARVAATSGIKVLKTPYHTPRVVFSIIITLVSFTSSPSSLPIFPSMVSRLRIRSWRRNKRQTNGYAGGISKRLLQGQRDSCWKEARGGHARSASWRRKEPSW